MNIKRLSLNCQEFILAFHSKCEKCLYIEKSTLTLTFNTFCVNALLYIFEAKNSGMKKNLNKLSLPVDFLKYLNAAILKVQCS